MRKQAWASALDELEQDLVQTNSLLDAAIAQEEAASIALERAQMWRVPQGLGSLPPDLVPRASEVLSAQKLTATRLARAMKDSRQHSRLINAVDPRPRDLPVYLDTEG